MSLPVPGVGTESGPDYAYDVNNALTLIDQHDHSAGSGVKVTPAGLNINATLNFNNNVASNVFALTFASQASAYNIGSSLSVSPNPTLTNVQELWYNDGVNSAFQITSNGQVNATIASLPGQSYSAGTFFWKQGAGSTTPANFDIGSIVLRPNVAATSYGVTLTPPAGIASAWTMTLPADPSTAGGSNFLVMDTSGNVTGGALVDNSSIQYTSHQLSVKAGGITAAMLASGVLPQMKAATFSSSGTWLAPANVNYILAYVIGGGGGGGSGGRANPGGDGGNGSIPMQMMIPVTPGLTYTVTIGAGGSGGAQQNGASPVAGNAGSNGSLSSVSLSGTLLMIANGGLGGGVSGSGGSSAWSSGSQQLGGGAGGGTVSNVAQDGSGSFASPGHGGTANPAALSAGGGGGGGWLTGASGTNGSHSGTGSGAAHGGSGFGGGGGGGQSGDGTGGNFGGAGGAGANGLVVILYVG